MNESVLCWFCLRCATVSRFSNLLNIEIYVELDNTCSGLQLLTTDYLTREFMNEGSNDFLIFRHAIAH